MSYATVHYIDYSATAAVPGVGPLAFWEYMDLRATDGVQLMDIMGGGAGTNLGYDGSVIYWCVEALIVTGFAGLIAGGEVHAPLCEQCGKWKSSRLFGPYLTDPTIAIPELEAGYPSGLAAPMTVPGSVTLTLYHCPACARASLDMFATGWQKCGRKEKSTKVWLTYPVAALADFEQFDRVCRAAD